MFSCSLVFAGLVIGSGSAAEGGGVGGFTVTDGPIVLHANLNVQWGDHAFSYALRGEKYIFWTAFGHPEENPEALGKPVEPDSLGEAKHWPARIVGQFPLPGTGGVPRVHLFDSEEFVGHWGVIPLLCRTPDGYLHLLMGNYRTPNHDGYLRYYRSTRPEDVSEWVDRTDLIPTQPYDEFHLRMNFAVSPDGERVVIVVLAGGTHQQAPFNTPVIFYGRREGLDFMWEPPRAYHEAMSLFYPLVAPAPQGIVIVGRTLSDDPNVPVNVLLHLGWEGQVLHQEFLPGFAGKMSLLSADLRPLHPGSTDRLLIYQNIGDWASEARHDFFVYHLTSRKLTPVRSLTTQEEGFTRFPNAGRVLYTPEGHAFLSGSSGGGYFLGEGDLLEGGPLTVRPVAAMQPGMLGYPSAGVPIVPNPLQGSVVSEQEAWVMSSVVNPGKPTGRSQPADGPYSLLLWRLVYTGS